MDIGHVVIGPHSHGTSKIEAFSRQPIIVQAIICERIDW